MTEPAAQEAADYPRMLLDQLSSSLSYWGTDLRCRYANPAYARWFGADPQALVGMALVDLLGPELYGSYEPCFRAAIAGSEQTVERQVAGPDGLVRQGLLTYIPDRAGGVVVGVAVQGVDISKLKAAQDALTRSEEYLHQMCMMVSEGIAVADDEGCYVDLNDAMSRMLGFSREELLGKRFEDLVCPFELPRVAAALEGDGPPSAFCQEWALQRKDGGVLPVELRAKFLPDGRRIGFFRDIGPYKVAEDAQRAMAQELEHQVQSRTAQLERTAQALKLSEGRLRGVFESTLDAIITVDEQFQVASANQAAGRMFGCAVDDMVGAPLERFIPQRFRGAHAGQMRQFGDSGGPARQMGAQREVLARRADGTEFPVEASISHVSVAGQRLYTVVHRDITERKQAEAALLASQATLKATLASMTDGLVVCDAQGRVVELNDAFVTLTRFADKPTCLQQLADYLAVMDVRLPSGEALAREQWPMKRALRGERGSGVEYLMVRRDTGESWFGSCSFSPLNGVDGSPAGAVLTVRDITPLKRAQAELELSHADLQRLIAARDEVQEIERKRIARELHDDLQQKLASIRMMVSQARQGAVAGDARQGAEKGDARQGAETGDARIPALLDEIDGLAATAIESNRRIVNDLQPQLLEDLGLVPALEALLRQFNQQTGIQTRLQQPDGDLSAALQSPGLSICLFRVVQEALNNVGKHAQAREVEVHLGLASPGQLRLRVLDNGVGMLESDRRKAGSFGLMGMRERVRAFGGQMRLQSRPDQGTDLEVTLPLPKAAPQPER